MNPETMTPAEKNEHYGKLNERFDGRAKELWAMGFRSVEVPGCGVGIWKRERFGRTHCIASALILCADELVWSDYLQRAKDFVA